MTDVPDSDVAERAEATLAAIVEGADVDADAATFDAPWQARAFAIAIALGEAGTYDWQTFQERLIERIEATGEEPVLWTQLGVSSPEAERLAAEAGLPYVRNRCVKIEYDRLLA